MTSNDLYVTLDNRFKRDFLHYGQYLTTSC